MMVNWNIYAGFHSHEGTPIAGWFRRENPNFKWYDLWGNPILGNPHILVDVVKIMKKSVDAYLFDVFHLYSLFKSEIFE